MLSVEEWNKLVQDIAGATQDQATMTTMLNKASMEYAELFATSEENRIKREDIEKENAELKKTNWEFFTQLGQQRKELLATGGVQGVKNQEARTEAQKRAETITVEDLFKEVK